jgi:protein SCO1
MITRIPCWRQPRHRLGGGYFVPMRSAAALCLLALLAACGSPAFHGAALDPPEPAPKLVLTDSAGGTFDLAAERGNVVLLFFGYTHCPDVCPTTLVDWRHAADSLGAKADRVRFVFVSVDPERDTPALAQRYASRFRPGFVGLTGTRAEVDALLREWKIAAFRDGVPGDTTSRYTVSHPSQVFVVDGSGALRLLQRQGLRPAQIAADIEALL